MQDSDDWTLDVCLNDGRTYVQGSQMLAEAARHLSDRGNLTLESAGFRSLTDRGVRMRSGLDIGREVGEAVGQVRFLTAAGPLDLRFEALPQRAPVGRLVSSAEIGPPSIDQGARTAVVEFVSMASLRDLLDAAVQLTKSLIHASDADARDVWFTALRGACLPADWSPSASGVLEASTTRSLTSGARVQTLNALTIRTDRFESHAVMVFAHRPGGA